jgi:peptidyl-prolyl cis-trans isomerase C
MKPPVINTSNRRSAAAQAGKWESGKVGVLACLSSHFLTFPPAHFLGFLLLCLLLSVPLSCSRGPQSPVLATVGERRITAEDFKKEIERRRAAHRPIPDKQTLLQEMVTFEALLQRARAAGLSNDPQVQHEINSLLVNRFQARELTPHLEALTVTPDEIKAEYEKQLSQYTRPAKTRLAVLALTADPKMSDARRAELRARMSEARQKTMEWEQRRNGGTATAAHSPASRLTESIGFGPLAIEYSDDQASRYRGGDLGWLDTGNFTYRWPREVLETGYALEQRHVSDVIETKDGFYLVMKTDSRPGSTVALAEVEAAIRQGLLVQKRRGLESGFREEAARAARATINALALAAVELQLSPPAASRNRESPPPAFSLSADAARRDK